MKHVFDFIHAAPQDIVLAVVGALLLGVVITDRVLAARWSR